MSAELKTPILMDHADHFLVDLSLMAKKRTGRIVDQRFLIVDRDASDDNQAGTAPGLCRNRLKFVRRRSLLRVAGDRRRNHAVTQTDISN